MRKPLVYDLPTRLFHWTFSSLFIVAFFIAKTMDDDQPTFSYHMLAGLMLGGLVVLRLIWGFVGTKYARFSSFALHPYDLIAYGKGILTGEKKQWDGHNPASSWTTLIMLGCAISLAVTGVLMTSGYKETYEEIHELFANAFLITVLLHIAGVALHALRHQDGIALTMVHGKKLDLKNQIEPVGHKALSGVLLILLIIGFGSYLFKNFNTVSGELNFFGKTLQLGESQNESEKDNEDDDDD